MAISELSSQHTEKPLPSGELLSRENVEAYIEGCYTLAEKLRDAVYEARAAGKKPTILIPSRGSLPLYVIGMGLLQTMASQQKDTEPLLNPRQTKHYPHGIFSYLSNGNIRENGPETSDIDVILYPFTADVSNEGLGGKQSKQAEASAQQFRESATLGFLQALDPH